MAYSIIGKTLVLKHLPQSLVALQQELAAYWPGISEEAQHGTTFEECLGIIAARIDIALDGVYDVADLCDVIVKRLQAMRTIDLDTGNIGSQIRDARLIPVDLIEGKDKVALQVNEVELVAQLQDAANGADPNCTICRGLGYERNKDTGILEFCECTPRGKEAPLEGAATTDVTEVETSTDGTGRQQLP